MECTILSQYACGCQVREFKRGEKGYRIKDVVIEYCPKHAAAPKMYEALKAMQNIVSTMRSSNSPAEYAVSKRNLRLITGKALASAEGRS